MYQSGFPGLASTLEAEMRTAGGKDCIGVYLGVIVLADILIQKMKGRRRISMQPPRDAAKIEGNYTWDYLDGTTAAVRIWWRKEIAGDKAVATFIRDEVDTVIWLQLTTLMDGQVPLPDDKYPPPLDNRFRPDNGGSPSLDIALRPLPPDERGSSYELGVTRAYDTPSVSPAQVYIMLNSDLLKDKDSDKELIQAATTHELMHAICFSFPLATGYLEDEYIWLAEATAQWAVGSVYPTNRRRHYFAKDYLENPQVPLNALTPEFHAYGAYLFFFFLTHQYGVEVMPAIWRAAKDHKSLAAVDHVLASMGHGGLAEVWQDFVRYNWNQPPLDQYQQWDKDLTAGATSFGATELALDPGERERVFPLELTPLEGLSAQYHHFTFTGPMARSTRSISFDPQDTLGSPSMVTVNVVTMSADGAPVDWGGTAQTFCRDQPSQNVESLTLILGNGHAGTVWTPPMLMPPAEARIVLTSSCALPRQVTLSSYDVIGGATATATVTLDQPAPAEGVLLMLKSEQTREPPTAASVPDSTVVPGGEMIVKFTVSTMPVAQDTYVFISAARSEESGLGGVSAFH
jgi:hypothetical protein